MIKLDLQVAVGGVDVPEHREGATFGDPWGVQGDQDHPVLVQSVGLGVRDPHHYGNATPTVWSQKVHLLW